LKSAPRAVAKPVAKPVAKDPAKKSMEFIGFFPMRKGGDDKKIEQKKQNIGPVFPAGAYVVGGRLSPLAKALSEDFFKNFLARHTQDKLTFVSIETTVDRQPSLLGSAPSSASHFFTKELFDGLQNKKVDMTIHNLKDMPFELPEGLVLGASLRREDPRDALVTRSTDGAIQELPHGARIGATSKRRIMQIKNIRPDLEIVPVWGHHPERLAALEKDNLDAVLVAWASLKKLNLSPRFYVALQPEQMLPSPGQGIIGIVCRAEDSDLIAKLRYAEDSEASWASRCERAFLQKLGGHWDAPVAAYAHRKGTQDPWILDACIGDARSGELLHHREIGTSRCKPESLADKAFTGILAKGARKFLPL